jgi:hypothetical protein
MNNSYNPYDPYNSCNTAKITNTTTTTTTSTISNINTNKLYNNIYKNLVNDIRNNKNLTAENIDFIESLSNDKKMEIILLYNKVVEKNKKIIDELLHTNSLK